MSIATTYPSHQEAHKHGWFSRRHQSADAHREAQDRWRGEREDKKAREDYQHETTAIERAEQKAAGF